MLASRRYVDLSRKAGAIAGLVYENRKGIAKAAKALGSGFYKWYKSSGKRKRKSRPYPPPPSKRMRLDDPTPVNLISGKLAVGRNRGGSYRGRFKKARRRKLRMSVPRNGVVYKQENGSIVQSSIRDSVYVGHAIAPGTAWRTICRALLKQIFALGQIHIVNYRDQVDLLLDRVLTVNTAGYRIAYWYRETSDATNVFDRGSVDLNVVAGSGETWEDWAVLLEDNIRTTVPSAADNYGELYFSRFELALISGDQVTTVGVLDMENLMVDMKFSSHLVLQNRTNDAAGNTNIFSTSNNPIHGKVYRSEKGWCNGFSLSRTTLSTPGLGYDPLFTFASTGIITTTSGNTEEEILKKPPPAWVLGTNKVSAVKMQPGAVRNSKLSWSASMKFNTWVQKLQKYVVVNVLTTTPRKCEIGFAELFGFECMMNDRTEETALQVGWELNQSYSVSMKMKRPATVPLIQVY